MPHCITYLHKALKMSIFAIYSHSSALTWQLRPKSLFNLYSNLCSISLAQLQYQHQLQDYYIFWQHLWCQSEMFIELFQQSQDIWLMHLNFRAVTNTNKAYANTRMRYRLIMSVNTLFTGWVQRVTVSLANKQKHCWAKTGLRQHCSDIWARKGWHEGECVNFPSKIKTHAKGKVELLSSFQEWEWQHATIASKCFDANPLLNRALLWSCRWCSHSLLPLACGNIWAQVIL